MSVEVSLVIIRLLSSRETRVMANVLILGGGFGGVVAAETLATNLSHEHQVTIISRNDRFLFYPALVRLAFGECDIADISFDLRKATPAMRCWKPPTVRRA